MHDEHILFFVFVDIAAGVEFVLSGLPYWARQTSFLALTEALAVITTSAVLISTPYFAVATAAPLTAPTSSSIAASVRCRVRDSLQSTMLALEAGSQSFMSFFARA